MGMPRPVPQLHGSLFTAYAAQQHLDAAVTGLTILGEMDAMRKSMMKMQQSMKSMEQVNPSVREMTRTMNRMTWVMDQRMGMMNKT